MNNEQYIRKAVELADGWSIGEMNSDVVHIPDTAYHGYIDLTYVKDALAAQLVRQVDALPNEYHLVSGRESLLIEIDDEAEGMGFKNIAWVEGPDRTMNSIKAIIDSGVLSE